MNNPKISVIFIYNNNKNIEKCLNEIQKQTFSNIEIICVDNSSKDNALDIVKEIAKQDERIKLINLPFENDEEFAKKAGFGIANGEFVCFLNQEDSISANFLMENFVNNSIKENIKIKNNHLYRRTFLENDEEITKIINEKIQQELEKYTKTISDIKNELKEEFNKFYQTNADNIKNSSYELACKFNNLENFVYEKEETYNNKILEAIEQCGEKSLEPIHQVYDDISRVYDYINAKINEKGTDINNVYEEINKNYHYTEQLIENKRNEYTDILNNRISEAEKKLKELEKEIIIRYVNIKRQNELRLNELKMSIGQNNPQYSLDFINKTIADNIEKLYEQINNNGNNFYTELTTIYKELNEKLQEQKADYNNELTQKINELRNEINSKPNNKTE